MKKTLLTILLCCTCLSTFAAVNIRDFGAKGDGKTLDSPAINAAIEQLASTGGGTINFPAGTYMCYSIRLKDNIRLHLESGAVIKAAMPEGDKGFDLPEETPSRYQDFGHSHWKNSLIWGIGLSNLTIDGEGLIDGTGSLSREGQREGGPYRPIGNKAISLKECKNVKIDGISMLNCGHFALLLTGVDNLTIHKVTVDTNRDAFDIDCCANVKIWDCDVNSHHDDGIVLKCSYGLGYAKATENVKVWNCRVSGYDVGTFLDGTNGVSDAFAPDRDGPTGRVKLGTESNGGFRNINVRNCVFTHCRGLALETVDGAVMENIKVSKLYMSDICNSPIYIRIGDRMRGPKELKPSEARNITIKNIKVKDADTRYASIICGIPGHCIENVLIKNVDIEYRGGITLDDVKNQTGANSFFLRMGGYPEPSAHGIQPAWGFTVNYAKDVTFKNIKIRTLKYDERPDRFVENSENIQFINFESINQK